MSLSHVLRRWHIKAPKDTLNLLSMHPGEAPYFYLIMLHSEQQINVEIIEIINKNNSGKKKKKQKKNSLTMSA